MARDNGSGRPMGMGPAAEDSTEQMRATTRILDRDDDQARLRPMRCTVVGPEGRRTRWLVLPSRCPACNSRHPHYVATSGALLAGLVIRRCPITGEFLRVIASRVEINGVVVRGATW